MLDAGCQGYSMIYARAEVSRRAQCSKTEGIAIAQPFYSMALLQSSQQPEAAGFCAVNSGKDRPYQEQETPCPYLTTAF